MEQVKCLFYPQKSKKPKDGHSRGTVGGEITFNPYEKAFDLYSLVPSQDPESRGNLKKIHLRCCLLCGVNQSRRFSKDLLWSLMFLNTPGLYIHVTGV
ncbi:hypothetical protein Q8A67_013059 [Cirrhinus molitorella]|uniref:Uncharacterized protein n=1 Tax=Cirrhinus molitorella TaxID=172907 RepID=A0AA88TLX1_9TELE|nr:hypothetical protein Q8A67_013059 [Cirrhinus molitorella]